MKIKIKQLSSLTKVFLDEEPAGLQDAPVYSGFQGENISFQIAYCVYDKQIRQLNLSVESDISKYVHIRAVKNVPVLKACNDKRDDNYLRTTPGLYPDLLDDIDAGYIPIDHEKWMSVWVTVNVPKDFRGESNVSDKGNTSDNENALGSGSAANSSHTADSDGAANSSSVFRLYSLKFYFEAAQYENGQTTILVAADCHVDIKIIPMTLPKSSLIHTEWFHGDCLADYYNVDVFSEAHWKLLDAFIEDYCKYGCNMILTPLFTPALDTAEDGERTTIQLVKVAVDKGIWYFDFELLERFVKMCRHHGIEYFEMSHLFSQWGAKYPPKIIGTKDGTLMQLFGWDTADMNTYYDFLRVFLPRLISELHKLGIHDNVYFHISDEPTKEQLPSYQKARQAVAPLLSGFPVFDAISDYDFFKLGLIDTPVVATDHIAPFIENKVAPLWSYYCTSQSTDVPNRFMSMPSYRNRVYGLLVYKYDIAGILHWGYNFYNSQYSLRHINPYESTDSDGAFPAGDPFLVYPGADGHPQPSIRLMVQDEALSDYRACKLLEKLTNKAYVMDILERDLPEPLTFTVYPHEEDFYLRVRERINAEIEKLHS